MPPTSQQLVDALPFDGYAVDGAGTVVAVAGATGAGAVGRLVWDALDGNPTREQVERAIELLRSGRAPAVRWEVPRGTGGDARTVLVQATPLRGADATDRYLVTAVDITPSHRALQALIDTGISLSRTIALDRVFAEVGLQLRRALECEAYCIAVADDDTAALRVATAGGYDESSAELEARLAPVWVDALANGRVVFQHGPAGPEVTAPMATPEGVLGAITVLVDSVESAERLDEAGRVLATLAAQTSAAIERAWLVRRVEHKRRLEAIGEVAAGVAHELRNPLFGISSAAQLLRFRVKEDPVIERNVGRILREVERLNRMVTALLDYGRPNAVRLAPGDPDAVWDDVLESQRGLLESRALVVHRTRGEPVRCALDAEQLNQLFVNLLVNAADAAPEASDLTLVTGAMPNGSWRSRLHNGGPAIPPEALARVFEIFFSSKPGGTGIGLALCQRIVDEHGGTIAIESAQEKGTAVTVVLPGL